MNIQYYIKSHNNTSYVSWYGWLITGFNGHPWIWYCCGYDTRCMLEASECFYCCCSICIEPGGDTLTGHHQSKEGKSLSRLYLINSSTLSTWHTGFSPSQTGLKWRRQEKQPILPSSSKLWRLSRTRCWTSTCGPKHVPNSRRLGALTSWSIILNPRHRVRVTTNPRSRLLRDRHLDLHQLIRLQESDGGRGGVCED